VARVKSARRTRPYILVLTALLLMVLGNVILAVRSDSSAKPALNPMRFVEQQGASLMVTSVSVKYTSVFRPYAASYLWHELITGAFVRRGAYNYAWGQMFDADVSHFLNPSAYEWGYGMGGAYIGEAYIVGGIPAVVLVSIVIGLGLRFMHMHSRSSFGLFIVTLILPGVLLMPRGPLFGWLSLLVRNLVSIAVLMIGWWAYRYFCSIQGSASGRPERPRPEGA